MQVPLSEQMKNSILTQAYLFPEIPPSKKSESPRKESNIGSMLTSQIENQVVEQGSDISPSQMTTMIGTKSAYLRPNPIELTNLRNVTDIPILDSNMAHSSGFRISKSKVNKNIRNLNHLYDAREQSE